MSFRISFLLVFFCFSSSLFAATSVLMKTNYGNLKIELYSKRAPISVKNFLDYVKKGYYKDTIFHRVIGNFMIQGGGFDTNLQQKKTRPAIKNEATNGLKNTEGTLAMARTTEVNSATSQFFINVKNNSFLNHTNTSKSGYGYAVFGKVKQSSMKILSLMKQVPVKKNGPQFQHLPVSNMIIKSITIIKSAKSTKKVKARAKSKPSVL